MLSLIISLGKRLKSQNKNDCMNASKIQKNYERKFKIPLYAAVYLTVRQIQQCTINKNKIIKRTNKQQIILT